MTENTEYFQLADEIYTSYYKNTRWMPAKDVSVEFEKLERWCNWAYDLIDDFRATQLDVSILHDENEVLKSRIAELEENANV